MTPEIEPLASEQAAAALAMFMSDLSEECWCAQWLIGTEFSLWAMVIGDDESNEWGMGAVSDYELDELRRLSELCGGWVQWRDGDRDTSFVPMAEWLQIYERYHA